MEERTQAYLRGRFGDYYRRTDPSPPPDAHEREWGYIPWTSGPSETMVRHKSLLGLGELSSFLEHERPRHVYYSAGRYADPGAGSMDAKDWRGSDLVFDLDADHLPSVDPEQDSYADMLATCKDALKRLLDFLESDFAFDDLTVVFSGGRGYHVHVRDENILGLESEARREIVDYVRGIGLDLDGLVTTEMRENVTARRLRKEGGWGKRVHDELLAFVDEIDSLPDEEATQRLQQLKDIGEGRANTIRGAIEANREAIEAGNLEAGGPGIRILTKAITKTVIDEQNAPIDEPVTTDTHRLIRLPGSLHGGSGLAVRHIERSQLDAFDPLVDAIPETFVGHDISVEMTEPGRVELDDDTFTLTEGDATVPEYLGVFLMARGRAEKGQGEI